MTYNFLLSPLSWLQKYSVRKIGSAFFCLQCTVIEQGRVKGPQNVLMLNDAHLCCQTLHCTGEIRAYFCRTWYGLLSYWLGRNNQNWHGHNTTKYVYLELETQLILASKQSTINVNISKAVNISAWLLYILERGLTNNEILQLVKS